MTGHELTEWVEDHRTALHQVAAQFGTDERVARVLALWRRADDLGQPWSWRCSPGA